MPFFYERKSKHNAAAQNINAAFWSGSVNERTNRRWYTKFETEDESFRNEYRDRPETGVDNEVLLAIVEKKTGNTDREYAEEIDVFPSNILRYLKLIGKV